MSCIFVIMDFSQFVNHFIALLVISNPLSALPAVLRITENQSLEEKRRTGITSAIAVGIIYLIITWIGLPLLRILGIQIPAFQVAGGLILLIMSLSMLSAEESPIKATPQEQKEKLASSGAIVPLAIPIIAGPGAISSLIVSVNQNPSLIDQMMISASAMLVAFVMGILLYFASNMERFLGKSGINIINRLGGLILASISIQILANGLIAIFPALR
ncbi:MAG: NAAT family transporter [Verrucomicrobiota bacterium]|nr:NAAT family transporter [Verrucomicrobiota bacterium]